MNKEMSLDVALDIIGTLRMMKIDEISEEKDENRKKILQKELSVLNTEEKIANGLLQFEVSENVRLSVMDKIQNYYAPKLKAYIIAAPKEFTQLGLYNRYQEEVLSKGQGRLADIDSHNKAVNGLMKSANQLYSDKAVDKISIHTYLAKERIKDFNLVNGEWSCKSMPSIFIDESRSKQMKNKEILNTNIQRGKELIESVTNPEVKKGMKEALSQLQSSLEKVQRQEKGLKKGFF